MSAETMDYTHSEGRSRAVWGRKGFQGSQGQAGCETRVGVVEREETVHLPGETDAPSTPRALAVPPLALPRRSALAGAGQAGASLVRLRTLTLDDRTTGLQPQAARELNQKLGGRGGGTYPSRPGRNSGRACWDRARSERRALRV